MGKIDLGKAFNDGWALFSKNLVTMIIGTLLVMIIGGLSLGILMPIMMGGLFMMIRKADQGEAVQVGDVFGGFSNFGTLFVAGLIVLLAIIIGSLACGVGAIVTGAAVIFMFPLIVDQGIGAGEAWNRSWAAFKANIGGLIVVTLVIGLLAGAGGVVAYIGSLFTTPFAYCVLWSAYKQSFAA